MLKGHTLLLLHPTDTCSLYKECRKILDEQAQIKTPKYTVVVKEKHHSVTGNTVLTNNAYGNIIRVDHMHLYKSLNGLFWVLHQGEKRNTGTN